MFENKKVFILGLARSGYEAAKLLTKRSNTVILNDNKTEDKLNEEHIEELRSLGVNLVLGSTPEDILDESFDYLIKNPGVPIDHLYVRQAKEFNIEVINEVEMAYRLLPEDVTVIGITGTNGKTTVTTLVYEILEKKYKDKVHLTGNIGYPLSGFLDKIKPRDIIVMEVSCQQLENTKEFKPDIGVFINLTPAHLDFFPDYEAYKNVKLKMFKTQTNKDIAILNIDNEDIMNGTKDIKSTCKYFSTKNQINGSYIKDNAIYYYDEKIIDEEDIIIKGIHNMENIMASIMVVEELDVEQDIIVDTIKQFTGVEHRLEYVDTINEVRYYNDTKATNVDSTKTALSSFKDDTILILGGQERKQDFHELTPYMENVKVIIGIGECRERILEYGSEIKKETYIFEHLKEGFEKAERVSAKGDIILLSPSSASWDQYESFEERGNEFKELINRLKKEGKTV